ncbi:MAG: DNA cytosine methyltransferase [Myxococcales bacterium]|nr:DNA cytosine methyltransferase [Myxococcales bacterium]
MQRGLVIDLFAGGGGASVGIEAALGRPIDVAINHSPTALAVHADNHPHTKHLTSDIWEVKPEAVVGDRPVDVLWASPDCTHHSVAKAGKPRDGGIRSLAWVVVEWARRVKPSVIFLENVPEFASWGPLTDAGNPDKARAGETFQDWKRALEQLGYVVDSRVLDASRFGAPTKRRRLFLVARNDGRRITWPTPTHGPGLKPVRTAAECIDWSIPCPSIFERARPLADNTLRRVAEGIRRFVLNSPSPFIVPAGVGPTAPTLIQTSYGERAGQKPRCLDLFEPLGTVVAQGVKHALVTAFLAKHYGGVVGTSVEASMSTVTATDHHSLVTAQLWPEFEAKGEPPAQRCAAFLAAYYGADVAGQQVDAPLRTITTKDRLALVLVAGVPHAIVDIGLRMLEPAELLKAQFGRFAETYDLKRAGTKTTQVRLIGNSVCPEVAEVLVRANCVEAEALPAAA